MASGGTVIAVLAFSRQLCETILKVAVTLLAADIVTVQLPVPEQEPLQPPKVEPEAADAVNLTLVPELKLLVQVEPQLMPEGLEVTVPLPVPDLTTDKL